MTGVHLRRPLPGLVEDRRGVSIVEFALVLPLFIGLMGAGLEMSNLILANLKVQRLATMTADMVAQRGSSESQISELQIYDILSALDLAAQPLDMRGQGRVAITAVLGEDSTNDGLVDVNRIKWQRFDGGLVEAAPMLGCWTATSIAVLPDGRALTLAEPLFHVQVDYRYQPLFAPGLVSYFGVPEMIRRTATFRGRGGVFKPVMAVEGYPPKSSCTSANGL